MKSKSLKDYIGTLPLTMEMFPEKQWTDDKGRQWTSNIKTSLEKNPKDNKWYLFPTMMGGLDLPFIGAYEGALKGKHFGVYDSKKEGMKADKAIHEYFDSIKGYQQGGAIEPDATKVHNNIDNLILEAELDNLAQTGSMRVDRTPEYIGGLDPIVENVALSPILTLKGLGSVGKKILEKTGLRNPISHYTSGENMASILRSGKIIGSEWSGVGSGKRTVSLTRDPMFTSRPHGSIGTDTRFIFDRDELIKKGIPTKPIAVSGFAKTHKSWDEGKFLRMNPRFEFEERVVGNIPVENAKLIDILRFPLGHSSYSYSLINLLGQLSRTNIPIIKSPEVNRRLKTIAERIDIDDIISRGNREFGMNTTIDDIYRLIDKPTYKFDPFKEVK